MADPLGIAALVGDLVMGAGKVADPYFYTEQEKGADALRQQDLVTRQQAITATAAAAAQREQTNQQLIKYGLAGVLGVSGIYLASRLVSR